MENHKRNIYLHIMATLNKLAAIHKRMAEEGISNAETYERKMALRTDISSL